MINSIHVAQTGLVAARTSVENVMNNISNENTPGYKKRVVELSEAEHLDSRNYGRGVAVDDTKRITNQYMYDNLMKQGSKQAYYDETSTILADIESVFFETEDSGFSSDLDRYFQAVEDLRSNPYNEIYKNNLSNQANIIVADLKNLYNGIEDRELVTRNSIDDDIATVNNILEDIGKVNEQIAQRLVEPNDLLDKRDELEKELSKFIDIEVDRTDEYELKIGGHTAVRYNTNIHSLTVVEDNIAQKDVYENSSEILMDDATDILTFQYNDSNSVSVTFGEIVDGSAVTEANKFDKLKYKINNDATLKNLITADIVNDKLVVISNTEGESGKFDSRLIFEEDSSLAKVAVTKNSELSLRAADDVHLEIFDQQLTLSSGSLKSMTENLTTNSSGNKLIDYKDRLDNFAKTLSDLTNSYIRNSDDSYVYGKKDVDINANSSEAVSIGLFSGANVDSLTFNEDAIVGLTQEKLDYLATHQWKSDIDFDGTSQNNTSFSKAYQTLLVEVSADKENTDFLKDTQDAVTISLQNNYNVMVKVDKDEEMLNLMKFQAAYEASAKIVTVVDEMLQTILGIIR